MLNSTLTGYRLSPQQKCLWLLQQDNSAHDAQCTIRIKGNVEAAILEAALRKIADRHEILRTVFQKRPGVKIPIQVIKDNTILFWNQVNLSNLTPQEQSVKIEELSQDKERFIFDWEQGPLFHATLVTLSNDQHTLSIKLPSLCADSYSLKNLAREISQSYVSSLQGAEATEETEEPVQYIQFSEWQNELLAEEEAEAAKAYWQDLDCQWVKLPFEDQSGTSTFFTPKRFGLPLDPDLLAKVKALASQYNVPTQLFFLACWQALLWRLTKVSTIFVKAVSNGRKYEELDEVLGLLAKSFPVSCLFRENSKFSEILQQISEKFSEAEDLQEYFIESGLETDLPICFEFEDLSDKFEAEGIEFAIEQHDVCFDQFKLKLNCVKYPDRTTVELYYDPNKTSASYIKCLAEQFETLLTSAAKEPEAMVSELNLLSDSSRSQLLGELNQTEKNYSLENQATDGLIHRLFEAQVERNPDHVALVFEDRQITYREVNDRANQLAHYLQELGVGPEVVVAIYMARSPEVVISFLGILKAGGAYLPLDPALPLESVAFRLQDAHVPVLLTEKEIPDEAINENTQIVLINELSQINQDRLSPTTTNPTSNPTSKVTAENLAYILYTSGSTGQPKGVAIEHRQIFNYINGIVEELGPSETENFAVVSTFAADLGNTVIFPALCTGGCLHIISTARASDPQALADYCRQHPIDYLKIVPCHLAALLTSSTSASILPRQRLILGGEAASWDLIDNIQKQKPNCQILNHYGPTETTVGALTYPVSFRGDINGNHEAPKSSRHYATTVPLGRPIANVQVYILDKNLQPTAIGLPGELYIGGDSLARGYLNRPQLTAEKFIDNPYDVSKSERLYRTGDLARYLPDGNIEFLGRIDYQVKIRGFRIELGEIETVLNQHPAIQTNVVTVWEEQPGNQHLVAYVVKNNESQVEISQLRKFLQQQLPEFMVPNLFLFLETLPLTANGKIDRKSLPAPNENSSAEQKYVAPRTEIEQTLTDIWQKLLLKKRVGIQDNFFEIGGDSILGIQVVSRAKNAGIQINVQQIFQNQTIAELALVANTITSVSAQQGIVTGIAPLTPIQKRFLAPNHPEAHHYNQSVLLQIPNRWQTELIKQALEKLLEHHDALRLRFQTEASEPKQINQGYDETLPFTEIDLSSTADSVQPQKLAEIATEYQTSLNLQEGPLMQVVRFNLGRECDARLLIIIHHLVVDGLSWRIFLSDLEHAYQQLVAGQAIQLSAKTTAFIDWAEKINSYAQSEKIKPELDYWLNQPWSLTTPLPVDYARSQSENTVGNAASVSVNLNIAETRALLGSVNEAYNTQINDLLLSALVISLAEWIGDANILIDLEGHGREELFEDVDLSRTVGWFTSVFPVLLQLPPGDQLAPVIKSIKEQLRKIPNRGIGFGILRYLCEDTSVNQQLQAIPTAEIKFNYLGQFDQTKSESQTGWKIAPESTGANQSSTLLRFHLLELNALVVEGELQINWTYNCNVHSRSTVENLAHSYVQSIRSIIEHCQREDAMGYTPSDFPDAKLNQIELDHLLAPLKAEKISSIYPLTPMQQGMLFHSLYAPSSGVYFNRKNLTLSGDLNIAAFKSSWQKVVDRHSVLRTLFAWENRLTPLQIVLAQVNLPWKNLDWRSLSSTEQQHQLSEFLSTQKEQGFPLNQAPLMGCTLIQLSEDTYKFIWSHHNILKDGWCLPIIFKEVLSFYEAEVQGENYYLPTPRPYRDYIAWLNEQDQEAAIEFWRQTLRGFNTPTPLVVDQLQPQHQQQQSSDYQEMELRLSETVSQKLQSVAQKHHVTLATIVQAAWGILLSRYSGEQDVTFGVTVSGRNGDLPGVENMVGLFINTLPLRLQVSPARRLISWLEEIQELMIEIQNYSYTPLVEVQALSELHGRASLFESILVFENYPIDDSSLNETSSLQISELENFEQTNYPLTLLVSPGKQLSVMILYDAARFESHTIERMSGHLESIFNGIVTNPQLTVGEVPLLSEVECHQLLVEWNNTASHYPQDKCIHQLFEAQVTRTPDAIALVFEEQQLTYKQLNQKANQLAHYLKTLGVSSEVLVGLCVERSLEMVVGLLGILKAGGAYVPIDPSYPQERLTYMLSDSAVSLVLTQQKMLAQLPALQADVVFLDKDWEVIEQNSDRNLHNDVQPENLAYIIYTSGSTGKPKGVQICHSSVVNFLKSMSSVPGLTEQDIFLAVTTISFDIAALELYLPLVVGARIVLASREIASDGSMLVDLLENAKATVMQATPATWRLLLAAQWQNSHGLKILCGGEALPRELVNQLQGEDTSIWNLYGPTEATIWSTIYQVGSRLTLSRANDSYESIGRPIANTVVYILDSHHKLVPIGVPGELHIGGEGLSRGYLNRQELTAEKFIANPFDSSKSEYLYKTGDLACYLPDGNIEFLGRLDNQVKIRGFRIELGEIEVVLNQYPKVEQAIVTVQEYSPGDKRLVGYLVCHSEPPTIEELRSFLTEKLPDYMIPSAFVMLDAFPLTANGKINRRALKPPTDRGGSAMSFVAPSTPVEQQLAAIWSEVLGIEKIGIHDNFFDLGGHSLLIIQVQNRLKEISSSKLTVIDLFKNPTINTLAPIIELIPVTETLESQSIQPISRQLKLPLSFSQQRLWFLDQLEQSAAYNMASSTALHGDLNLNALERTFIEIIRRHEVLRTSFQMIDGEAVQIISDNTDFTLSVIDWRKLSKAEQEKQVRELGISEGQHIYDLSKGPLFQVTLIRLADQEHILMFVIHHIIFDEWSFDILIRELVTLYDAFSYERRSPLPDLSIQYADFSYWQRQYLQGDLFAKQLAYWQEQLADVPRVLALPTDRPQPEVQSFRGATIKFEIPSEISNKIKQVSQSEKVTLFMMLLTGFQTLLYCYSRQQDFCIGSPITNRNQRETEKIMGFFVNTIVLRANLSGNPSFRELLQRVKKIAIEAFAYQDLPFEKLVEELKIERSLSHNPLFQVWFVFHNMSTSTLEMPGLSLTPLEFDNGFVRHDLRLGLWETSAGFSGSFQYKTELFDAETIVSMVKDLETIFTHLVANIDMKLDEMSDIIEASKKQKQALQQQKLESKNRQRLKKAKRKSVNLDSAD